jgi:hypothetical protein
MRPIYCVCFLNLLGFASPNGGFPAGKTHQIQQTDLYVQTESISIETLDSPLQTKTFPQWQTMFKGNQNA